MLQGDLMVPWRGAASGQRLSTPGLQLPWDYRKMVIECVESLTHFVFTVFPYGATRSYFGLVLFPIHNTMRLYIYILSGISQTYRFYSIFKDPIRYQNGNSQINWVAAGARSARSPERMVPFCFPRKEEVGCLAHTSPIASLVILVAERFEALHPFPMIALWLVTLFDQMAVDNKDMMVPCNDQSISRPYVYYIITPHQNSRNQNHTAVEDNAWLSDPTLIPAQDGLCIGIFDPFFWAPGAHAFPKSNRQRTSACIDIDVILSTWESCRQIQWQLYRYLHGNRTVAQARLSQQIHLKNCVFSELWWGNWVSDQGDWDKV